MKLRRLPYLLVASTAAAAFFGFAPNANAQTIAVTASNIKRQVALRNSANKPYWISRADCLANDVLSIPITYAGLTITNLQVWASFANTNCKTGTNRNTTSEVCWKVYEGALTGVGATIPIRAQDIVSRRYPKYTPNGPGSGTAEDCKQYDNDTTSDYREVLLQFLITTSGSTEDITIGTNYATAFDMVGPSAPTGIKLGIGENMLSLDWDQNQSKDVTGYSFFCDPPLGSTSSSLSPRGFSWRDLDSGTDGDIDASSADASDDATSDASDAATSDAGVSDASKTDATTSDAATDSSSSDASTAISSCPSTALVVDTIPDGKYLCGSVSGSNTTHGKIKSLENGQVYSVGITATDLVGNSGPLSEVKCEAPQPIDDFFKIYKQAGGEGGGSFCNVRGPVGGKASLAALGLLALAAGALVRRRRS